MWTKLPMTAIYNMHFDRLKYNTAPQVDLYNRIYAGSLFNNLHTGSIYLFLFAVFALKF